MWPWSWTRSRAVVESTRIPHTGSRAPADPCSCPGWAIAVNISGPPVAGNRLANAVTITNWARLSHVVRFRPTCEGSTAAVRCRGTRWGVKDSLHDQTGHRHGQIGDGGQIQAGEAPIVLSMDIDDGREEGVGEDEGHHPPKPMPPFQSPAASGRFSTEHTKLTRARIGPMNGPQKGANRGDTPKTAQPGHAVGSRRPRRRR